MKTIAAAWCLGVVLAVAVYECASTLPSLAEISAYGAAERLCVSEASTRDAAESCVASTRFTFCQKWPDVCDGGGQ